MLRVWKARIARQGCAHNDESGAGTPNKPHMSYVYSCMKNLLESPLHGAQSAELQHTLAMERSWAITG